MTENEIFKKASNTSGIEAMTGNERLSVSGLMDEFDKAKKSNPKKAKLILEALKFDQPSIQKILGKTIEIPNFPNPWDFPEKSPNGREDNNKASIEYSQLMEIAMGAPLAGVCKLHFNESEFLINTFAGGQPIWSGNGMKLAISIWEERTLFRSRHQRIGIIDLKTLTLTKYKKRFSIIAFKNFSGKIIKFIDSPIYKSRNYEFDLEKEKIESVIELKN